jgi:tryptophan-rich sensory protein
VVLDFIVLANIAAFWAVKRRAAWLLIPYGLWLLFATALNASIAVVNG